MIVGQVKRGAKAGMVGGIGYGLFIALVAHPLIAFIETAESGGTGHSSLSPAVTTATSIGAGIVWGLLFGILVFGILYHFLEPALPGAQDTRSYILGALGFITISGVPWLLFPPQPPGVEQALSTQTQLLWYGIMVTSGGIASGGVVYCYLRLTSIVGTSSAVLVSLLVFGIVLIPLVLAPSNPTQNPLPATLTQTFQWIVITGQMLLWLILASTHAWLIRRRTDDTELEAIHSNSNLQPSSDTEP